jgi:signal transduction histidine kinase
LEFAVGLIWFAFSLIGWVQGRSGPGPLLIDVVALAALLLAVFRPVAGLVAMMAVVLLALLLDPTGVGMCHYIALCALVLTIRQGRFGASAVASAVIGGTIAATMLRRSGDADGVLAALIAAPALVALAWLIGGAFRLIVRAERDRLSLLYAESHVRMAMDIHDFVSRNLTSVLARAETEKDLAETHPAFTRDLVARLRQSSTALRVVTQDLQQVTDGRGMPSERAADVLEAEADELRLAGFTIEIAAEATDVLDDLPSNVDFVVSRVLAETLHNVSKHGDPSEPCVIDVKLWDGEISIIVRNKAAKRGRRTGHRPLGLRSMARHASLTAGTVTSEQSGVHHWECTASFPLPRGSRSIKDENPGSHL